MADIESVSLVVREVFVYRVTARGSNRGYRADDWGLDKPLWTGRLKITTKGPLLTIILQDSNTGEMFAQCPISNEKDIAIAVEPVIDSSRYFVIRVLSETGQHAFLGLGFAERSNSFDFNVAIQDHFKREKKEAQAQVPYTPKHDFSGFKEGQTIHISIKSKKEKDPAAPAPAAASSGAFALRPPPGGLFPGGASPAAAASNPFGAPSSAAPAAFNPFGGAAPAAAAGPDSADWSDFSSAPRSDAVAPRADPRSSDGTPASGNWVKF